jgi:hypothetical protein
VSGIAIVRRVFSLHRSPQPPQPLIVHPCIGSSLATASPADFVRVPLAGFSTSLHRVRSSRYALLWLRHQGHSGRGPQIVRRTNMSQLITRNEVEDLCEQELQSKF